MQENRSFFCCKYFVYPNNKTVFENFTNCKQLKFMTLYSSKGDTFLNKDGIQYLIFSVKIIFRYY